MINFNKPFFTDKTLSYIEDVLTSAHSSGDGKYTKLCHEWLKQNVPVQKSLLVHSGTAALEMQALLADIEPGDEVILPSYTFVSTANAFVLRGATPVFVDIRKDTMNIDESLIEQAITSKTRAIVPVHYAGVSCEMDEIIQLAKSKSLYVFEDAAQAFGSTYKGRPLGALGELGAFSFHETKNIMSGEGGALLINDPAFNERAEIIREKGTNRSKFFRGQVDKYTWVDVGSSFLPSDLIAAYLYSGLEISAEVKSKRIHLWNRYYEAFSGLEAKGLVRRPVIPAHTSHNGHMFYLLLASEKMRAALINYLKEKQIMSVFHYIPLHSAPYGKKVGRYVGDMKVTSVVSDTLLRLPLFYTLTDEEQDKIIEAVCSFMEHA